MFSTGLETPVVHFKVQTVPPPTGKGKTDRLSKEPVLTVVGSGDPTAVISEEE